MWDEADLVPLSALQHWIYCPRQCGLIYLERVWAENRFTAEGRLLHEKAHEAGYETRGQVRIARGLSLRSEAHGLVGVADVVEFHRADGHWLAFPVEYKRGRSKDHAADRAQLCAQALCLEEMLGQHIAAGALFYGQSRRRQDVDFDAALRGQTIVTIAQVRAMLRLGRTPPPPNDKRCPQCSLRQACLPAICGTGLGSAAWLARKISRALEEP